MILERLSIQRVLDVTLSTDKKTITFDEACDYYFDVDLNKEEFGLLIEELKILYEQMAFDKAD